MIIFLALALTVSESCGAEIAPFLCTGLAETRGEGRQDWELQPDLLSHKLQFLTSCSKAGQLCVLGDRKLSCSGSEMCERPEAVCRATGAPGAAGILP